MVWRRQWHPTPVLLHGKSHGWRSLVGCSPWGRWGVDTTERLHFHALEKEMATHSSVLAWRIPGTAEPGGLPSMGSHRVGHNWIDLAADVAHGMWDLSSPTGIKSTSLPCKHRVYPLDYKELFKKKLLCIFLTWYTLIINQKVILCTHLDYCWVKFLHH